MAGFGIDYRTTYFEYHVLIKTHGRPTYDKIKTLHNELKANSQTVPSDLGGGAYGHLGLVVHPVKYAFISNVPYLKPNTPVRPQNVAGLAQHQITAQRDLYLEQLWEYREVTAIENSLRQQVVTSVEPMFIASLHDHTTKKSSRLSTTFSNTSTRRAEKSRPMKLNRRR